MFLIIMEALSPIKFRHSEIISWFNIRNNENNTLRTRRLTDVIRLKFITSFLQFSSALFLGGFFIPRGFRFSLESKPILNYYNPKEYNSRQRNTKFLEKLEC